MEGYSTPVNCALLTERFERDSAELLARLGPIYLKSMPDLMSSLEQAVHQRDRTRLYQTAHTIKGNAAAISADYLQQSAEKLEKGAQTRRWSELEALVAGIAVENSRVSSWLVAYR